MSSVLAAVDAARDAIRRHPWWTDSLLALFVTFISLGSVAFSGGSGPDARSLPVFDAILVPFTSLPIAARRYRPLMVLAITVTAETVLLLFSSRVQVPFGVIVALYTVASRCERPVAARAAAWVAPPITVGVIVNNWGHGGQVIPHLAVVAIAWLVGDNLRTRRAYLAQLEERAARLEREREQQATRATLEERARIARELHDVIAHNVSVMVVQASAGEDVFDSDPGRAREALAAVASTGRDALGELRRLLGVIRPGEQEALSFAPQPGIGRLGELIEQVHDTGLAVELSIEGEQRDLPEATSLCVYRIVQEALTNTLKHAGATRAQVSLRYDPDELRVRVSDDGRGTTDAAANGGGEGHGLIGMRERVALFGGQVQAGRSPDGGYCVTARLPVQQENT
jgi:signal transduction histidine kinase